MRTGCGGAGGDGADAVQFVPSRMSLGSQARASRTAAATPAATNGGARRVRHASRTLPHRPGPGCRRPPSSLATASSRVTTASGLVTSACLTSPRRGSPRPRASPSARASPQSQVTSVAGGRRLGRGGQRLGALSPRIGIPRYRILYKSMPQFHPMAETFVQWTLGASIGQPYFRPMASSSSDPGWLDVRSSDRGWRRVQWRPSSGVQSRQSRK